MRDATLPARVCLITPPSVFLMDERVFMTLGILKVAAVLEQDGIVVEMLDLSGIKNYLDAVRDHAGKTEAMHFGITATTPQLPAASQIARMIHQARPEARVILGGPHVTLVNAARKREMRLGRPGRAVRAAQQLEGTFDHLVAGDGETGIFPVLRDSALTWVDGDDPHSALFLTNESLTNAPHPARHLVDVSSYHYQIDGERALSLIAQLGCPFECGFCGGRLSSVLRRVRMRSSERVVDEMVQMYKAYGNRGFMMYDDELNVNRKMVELMQTIRKAQDDLGAEWRLRGFIKSQLFTDAQARAMVEAGFRWILVGFESGAPRILENINKRATRDENTRCMEIAHRHGLKVKALMSIGHPGESVETIAQTKDWLLEARPDDFDLTVITTYPGTPYYDYAVPHPDRRGEWVYTYEKTGDRLYGIELDYMTQADYYKGTPGEYQAYVYTDHIGPDALAEERDRLEQAVRATLGIPFNPSAPAVLYEHSMGQLPSNIYRNSQAPWPEVEITRT